MSLTVRDTGGGHDWQPAPEGTHLARCTTLIDLGTQETEYKGVKKLKQIVLIGWELPEELDDDKRPLMVWRRYTASLNEKSNLRKNLEAWRGRKFTDAELQGFDLKDIVGVPCMVCVTHSHRDGNTYANVDSVMALARGMKCPDQVNHSVVFDLEKFDAEVFDDFSDNLKHQIMQSAEYKARQTNGPPLPPEDEAPAEEEIDLPF